MSGLALAHSSYPCCEVVEIAMCGSQVRVPRCGGEVRLDDLPAPLGKGRDVVPKPHGICSGYRRAEHGRVDSVQREDGPPGDIGKDPPPLLRTRSSADHRERAVGLARLERMRHGKCHPSSTRPP